MRTTFNAFFLPVLVLVIGSLFTWWISHDKYDVRFALSERVPDTFDNSQQQAIQQISVVNLSKKEVTSIQVLLPGRVTAYKILKNSEADQVSEFKTADRLELVYDKLPPDGSFRVIFKSTGDGVTSGEVSVKHSNGRAESALSTPSQSQSLLSVASVVLIVIYIIMILVTICASRIFYFEKQVKYDASGLLKRRAPFCISNEKWDEIRVAALHRMALVGHWHGKLSNIFEVEQFQLLEGKMPSYLSDEEWRAFCKQASESIAESLSWHLSWTRSLDDFIPVLERSRPINFMESSWGNLMNEVQGRFFDRRMCVPDYMLTDVLKAMPFRGVDQRKWIESQEDLQKRYFVAISDALDRAFSPMEKIDDFDLNLLGKSDVEILKKKAYDIQLRMIDDVRMEYRAKDFVGMSKPKWMLDSDFNKIRADAEFTVAMCRKCSQVELILDSLQNITSGISPTSYIQQIDEPNRGRIEALNVSIKGLVQKNEEICEKLRKDNLSLAADRVQVTRQLEFLGEFLKDPSCVNRVENYNIPFALGNWEIILKLSKILSTTSSAAVSGAMS